MQKNLRAKLEKLSREQLLELLEELCNAPDVQKTIRVMVIPSKNDIDRLVHKLADRCEIYMCNSCSLEKTKVQYKETSSFLEWYSSVRFS